MDKQAFAQRALSCAGRLHRVAYAILGHEADCEDAVSEALLRAWVRLDSLREIDYFETWLTRILINVCKSMRRARQLRGACPLGDVASEPPAPDPALRDALMVLDVKLRLPLLMHHVEGYPVREISRMLNLPQTTVKWRMHAARKALREALAKGDE